MSPSTRLRALLAISGLLATAVHSSAAVLAQEDFLASEYSADSKLIESEGGSGFGGAWDDGSQFGKENIRAGSLAFPSLPGAGNKIETDPSATLVSRSLFPSIAGTAGRTIWVGFLLRKTDSRDVDDDYFEFQLISSGGTGLAIGDLGGDDLFSLHDTDQISGLEQSLVQSAVDETVWLVVSVDFASGHDTFRLFVNPTPGFSEPNTPDAQKTDFNLSNIVSIGYLKGHDQTWELDGIRIGDEFSDLVPEPTTAGLLGLGAGLLAMRRRDRPAR